MENSKSMPDIGLVQEFRGFINDWNGRSIKDAIFIRENEIDDRFLPFQEPPPDNISSYDLHGFVLEWARQILHNLNCIQPVGDAIARLVVDAYYTDFQVKPQRIIEAGETLWSTVVSQVDSILQHLSQEEYDEDQIQQWSMLQDSKGKFSIYAIKNGRRTMEDVHVSIPDLNALLGLNMEPPTSYYAVFDGHAGNKAACYAATHLHHKVSNIPTYNSDMLEAIRLGIKSTDEGFINHCNQGEQSCKSGCTAVCCFIQPTKLYLAWVGDSQGIVFGDGQPFTITTPHKPEREDERERIEKLGGCVVHMGTWRVNGTLAVSRAIGDIENKPYITSEPDVLEVPLTGKEEFVLLACDGMWDVLNDDDVSNIAYSYFGTYAKESDGPGLAASLVTEAKKKGSTDNITIVVIYLQDYERLHQNYLHLAASESSTIEESLIRSPDLLDISQNIVESNSDFTFDKLESQHFNMEQISSTTASYLKSEYSQEWSTITNETFDSRAAAFQFSSETESACVNDFEQVSAASAPVDEIDLAQLESTSLYNKNSDIENPLPDVFEGKHLEASSQLLDEQVETGKFGSEEIINWSENSQQTNPFDNFECREEMKATSQKSYFESNLSPDAEPFVSRYATLNQEFLSDTRTVENDESNDLLAASFTPSFDAKLESEVALPLNPFAAEVNFEPTIQNETSTLFESYGITETEPKKVESEKEPSPLPNDELNEMFVEQELDHVAHVTHELKVTENLTQTDKKGTEEISSLQNVVFDAEIMVPEVKLDYTQGLPSMFDSELRLEASSAVEAYPAVEASPTLEAFSTLEASPALETFTSLEASSALEAFSTLEASPALEVVSTLEASPVIEPLSAYDIEEKEKCSDVSADEAEEINNLNSKEECLVSIMNEDIVNRDSAFSPNPDFAPQPGNIIDNQVTEHLEIEQQFNTLQLNGTEISSDVQVNDADWLPTSNETEVSYLNFDDKELDSAATVMANNNVENDFFLSTGTTESQNLIINEILDSSDVNEVQFPIANMEPHISEEPQSVFEKVPAAAVVADVEDDESEDGEGWKFYPPESSNGTEIKLDHQTQLAVDEFVSVATTIDEITATTAVEVQQVEPIETTLKDSEQSKTLPPIVKIPPKPKVPSTKSTKTESVKSTQSSTTIHSSSNKSTTSKDLKKPTPAAKSAPRPAVAASKTTKTAAVEGVKKDVKSLSAAASAAKVTAVSVPAKKSAPVKVASSTVTKRTTNGTVKAPATQEKPKSSTITKVSDGANRPSAAKTTSSKSSTSTSLALKASTSTVPKESLPPKKPVATALKVAKVGTVANVQSKIDNKQVKEVVNKNLSGVKVSSRTTTTTSKQSSNAKVDINITSKVSSTIVTTTNSSSTVAKSSSTSTRSPTSNGTSLANKGKTTSATKMVTATITKSPAAGASAKLSPTKAASPLIRSSASKSPTAPKTSRSLNLTPKTPPTSASKSNRLHSTPKSASPSKKLLTKTSQVEKGSIDAQSKEIHHASLIKNNDMANGGGEPKIELELQNGFGKLSNGNSDEVAFHTTSANGSIITTETVLQTNDAMLMD